MKELTPRVNDAYRTYTSVWLDWYDRYTGKYKIKNKHPLNEWDNDIRSMNEDDVVNLYLKTAVELLKKPVHDGIFKSPEALYFEYPMLKEKDEDVRKMFYT